MSFLTIVMSSILVSHVTFFFGENRYGDDVYEITSQIMF